MDLDKELVVECAPGKRHRLAELEDIGPAELNDVQIVPNVTSLPKFLERKTEEKKPFLVYSDEGSKFYWHYGSKYLCPVVNSREQVCKLYSRTLPSATVPPCNLPPLPLLSVGDMVAGSMAGTVLPVAPERKEAPKSAVSVSRPGPLKTYIGKVKGSQSCMRDYKFKNVIEKGGSGVVWVACKEGEKYKKCPYAVKVVIISPEKKAEELGPLTEAEFNQEAKIAELAGSLGVGPRVYASWICDDNIEGIGSGYRLGFIAMQRLKDTIFNWSLEHPNEYLVHRDQLYNEAKAAIETLLSHGVQVGDLHAGNIMVEIGPIGDGIHVKLIDYGDAKLVPSSAPKKDIVEKLYNNLKYDFGLMDSEASKIKRRRLV